VAAAAMGIGGGGGGGGAGRAGELVDDAKGACMSVCSCFGVDGTGVAATAGDRAPAVLGVLAVVEGIVAGDGARGAATGG